MVDVTELMVHWHAGRSQSELAISLGLDRKTVKKYLAPAVEAGIVPGDGPRSLEAWGELVRGWWPELVDTRTGWHTTARVTPGRRRGARPPGGCGG